MIKADIVNAMSEKGYYKNRASEAVDDLFDVIKDALVRGEDVQIRGFGTFSVKTRKGRNLHNVATGEMIVTEDHKLPVFHASNALKSAVRQED